MIYRLKKLGSYINSPQKIKKATGFVIANPGKAYNYFFRIGSKNWIKQIFDTEVEFRMYYDEIDQSTFVNNLNDKLKNKFTNISGKTARGNPFIAGTMKNEEACTIYAILRKIKPECIVETGVCNGFSTAVILEAIRRNGVGILHSIDFPEYADERTYTESIWEGKGGAVVPADETSGWIVPDDLRKYWKLYIDKSQKALPPLLKELGAVDVFIHDSEHSYDNQFFEFDSAKEVLSSNGLIIASDISWNDAFNHFMEKNKNVLKSFFIDHNLAIVLRS